MSKFVPLYERYNIEEETGCWIWNMGLSHGYGVFFTNHGGESKVFRAHRYFYEFFNSTKIPKGIHLHHICKDTRCVNPAHLKPVNTYEHRQHHQKDECKRGHPLSGDNMYIDNRGNRQCKTCQHLRTWKQKYKVWS